ARRNRSRRRRSAVDGKYTGAPEMSKTRYVGFLPVEVPRSPRGVADAVLLDVASRNGANLRMRICTKNSGVSLSPAAAVRTFRAAVACSKENIRAGTF